MQLYEWNQVKKEQMNPLFVRQVIHGKTMTVARLAIRDGCSVTEHSHHNEQISMIEQGSMRVVLVGVEKIVRAGEVLQIPPHLPHSAVFFSSRRRHTRLQGDWSSDVCSSD